MYAAFLLPFVFPLAIQMLHCPSSSNRVTSSQLAQILFLISQFQPSAAVWIPKHPILLLWILIQRHEAPTSVWSFWVSDIVSSLKDEDWDELILVDIDCLDTEGHKDFSFPLHSSGNIFQKIKQYSWVWSRSSVLWTPRCLRSSHQGATPLEVATQYFQRSKAVRSSFRPRSCWPYFQRSFKLVEFPNEETSEKFRCCGRWRCSALYVGNSTLWQRSELWYLVLILLLNICFIHSFFRFPYFLSIIYRVILVIVTKNWSRDQFQSSSRPNFHCNQIFIATIFSLQPYFGNIYQKLVTLPISIATK